VNAISMAVLTVSTKLYLCSVNGPATGFNQIVLMLKKRSERRRGLSLANRGKHAFTEIQAFPLRHPSEGIPELVHLIGELA